MTEAFPDLALWEKLDDDCKTAEAASDPLIEAAKSERDLVVNRLPHWKVLSRERIKAAAEARYDQKVKAAQDTCEAACQLAEKELKKALDMREKAHQQLYSRSPT